MRNLAIALALTGLLAACSPAGQNPAPAGSAALPVAATGMNAARGPHYSNAFAYCRAIGTIDKPDSRYTGPTPPPDVIAGLKRAFHAPASATANKVFTHGTYWRCMDKAVYACNVGANLPCNSPANTDSAPTRGEKQYCAENHDAAFIPMYVTGHDTVYNWSCEGVKPVAGKQIVKVDSQGYLANIWYHVPPPGSAPTPATSQP